MKRYIIALICMLAFVTNAAKGMDYETARRQAYYLTDKMAYELNLNSAQYDDIYEINLDYFLQLRTPADVDAMYLMYRNEDIRYILHDWQWAAFHTLDYFFRPVRWLSGAWYFPIYRHYGHTHFFYSRPTVYVSYHGGHGRPHTHGRPSYYHDRRPHWNGGMRGDKHHTVAPPDRGHNNRFDKHPGKGDNRPRPNAGNRRPESHNQGVAGTPGRRGNEMRSSSRTTVSGGRTPGRGGNASTPSRGTNPSRGGVSAPSRGTGNTGRSSVSPGSRPRSGNSSAGSSRSSSRSSRSGSEPGNSRSGRR